MSNVVSVNPAIFVASALFALVTVLISCRKPGRMAARVSPIEAVRYAVSYTHLPPIEIPTLLFWENGNTWYGSKGQARFFIQPVTHEAAPDTPDAPSHTTLDIEFWRGPLTKALSHICSTASFPLSGEGLEQTVQWLEEQAAIVNEE